MREWSYWDKRTGWVKTVPGYVLRYWYSGRYWLAAAYFSAPLTAASMIFGTRSRHETPAAARRKLLAWVQQRAKKGAIDG